MCRQCCRRLPLWRCQARQPQVLHDAPTAVDSSLPTFAFRVNAKQGASKLRLDSFLATQIAAELSGGAPPAQDVSRAKIQAAIAAGRVLVNDRPAGKASQQVKAGDRVECSLPPPPPLRAEPEALPLDIRYEDEHLLVINKPAGMVVHVAPGHHSGTLVNALLHHCALPPLSLELQAGAAAAAGGAGGAASAASEGLSTPLGAAADVARALAGSSSSIAAEEEDLDDDGDLDDEEDEGEGEGLDACQAVGTTGRRAAGGVVGAGSYAAPVSDTDYGSRSAGGGGGGSGSGGILRPGIVHRLDKGTSGLLVVAKTETALTRLQAQFKARTVERLYVSITAGCPAQQQGRVEANVVRDPRDRKRMAAAPYGSGRGRTAASGYTVVSPLAGGGAALVQWKLDTGRTHQIRVHAKHIGHPLLGDDTYGGTGPSVVAAASRNYPADQVRSCIAQLGRPALHALTLGFTHPATGQRLAFQQPPPEDFQAAVRQLQGPRELIAVW